MPLSESDFLQVVQLTPLVAIDLLVHDSAGRYLLGLRSNRPAQGDWFVPGGRIHKGESLDAAFARITQTELGQAFERVQARWQGVAEHHYPDNFAGEFGVSTHYVVLAYALGPLDGLLDLPPEQHQDYRWLRPSDILLDQTVHVHSKDYFR